MKKIFMALLSLVFFAFAHDAAGQTNNDPCGCNPILATNFRNEILMIDSAKYNEALSIFFSRDFEYWESGSWETNRDLQSGGAYGIISGYFNASESKGEQHAKFQKDSSLFKQTRDISQETYHYLSQKTTDHSAYNKWADCKSKCPTFYGILLSYTIANGNEVTVTLRFKQANVHIKEHIKDIIRSSNLIPAKGNYSLKKPAKIIGTESYAAKFIWTDMSKDASITISITGGGYDPETLIIPSKQDLLPKIDNPQIPKIEIANGAITQNADIKANWGDRPTDENSDFHHSPQTVPYDVMPNGKPEGPFTQGASSTTRCISTVDYDSNSHYKWTLNLTNTFHANSGPLGQGGSSYAAPYYKTTIKLPKLLATQSSWNVIIDGSSWVTNSQDRDMVDKEVRVDFTSNGINRSFSFKTKSQFKPENFKIDSLKPGDYTLTLQVSKIGLEAKFQQPNDDKVANVQTQLSVEISANIAPPSIPNKPPVPPDYSIYYWIGGIIFLVLIFYLIYKKRKSI